MAISPFNPSYVAPRRVSRKRATRCVPQKYQAPPFRTSLWSPPQLTIKSNPSSRNRSASYHVVKFVDHRLIGLRTTGQPQPDRGRNVPHWAAHSSIPVLTILNFPRLAGTAHIDVLCYHFGAGGTPVSHGRRWRGTADMMGLRGLWARVCDGLIIGG